MKAAAAAHSHKGTIWSGAVPPWPLGSDVRSGKAFFQAAGEGGAYNRVGWKAGGLLESGRGFETDMVATGRSAGAGIHLHLDHVTEGVVRLIRRDRRTAFTVRRRSLSSWKKS